MGMIVAEDLTKRFFLRKKREGFFPSLFSFFSPEVDEKLALDHLSFSIGEGELVGFIGPNGAGKSTTVKLLSGILIPDSGTVRVMGKVPWKHRVETVRHLGVLFGQKTQLWWDLPVIESFLLLKALYDIPKARYQQQLEELSSLLKIRDLFHIPVRFLSLGQRMRCDMVASLLHSPRLLFLDEPTIGLDAISKLALRDCIRHLNRENKITVFLTTHDMDDIEALCSRVLILNKGALYFDGTLKKLRKMIAPERWLVVDLLKEDDKVEDLEAEVFKREGHRVWLRFNPEVTETASLISRVAQNHSITDLFVENPPIEHCIARIYT